MQLTSAQRAGLNGGAAAREWMRHRGHTPMGYTLWSEAEVALVRLHYPDYETLVRLLPHRTRRAIEAKVAKLGRARPRRVWVEAEIGHFKPPYKAGVNVSDILPLLNNKSADQLYNIASRRGIRRPRRRPKMLGVPVLDSIRQRAFDMHISLKELDEATGQTKYFASPRSLRWNVIRDALKILGGRPVIRWREP